MTPTARSTQWLKDNGYIVAKVEQRLPIPGKFITRDAFNFGDLLCAGCGNKEMFGAIALVQVTSTGNMSAREKKILAIPEAALWVNAGGEIWLHGWSKKGARGERKTWQLTQRRIEP